MLGRRTRSSRSHPFLVPPPQDNRQLLTPYWNVLDDETEQVTADSQMLIYQVEFHQKFAVPLSSFCFVLIGMALALKYPGSGIGLVIGGSLVIFLGFYIMLHGGEGIAQRRPAQPGDRDVRAAGALHR